MALEILKQEGLNSRNGSSNGQPNAGSNLAPARAIVEIETEEHSRPHSSNILRTLGWDTTDPASRKRLRNLLERIDEAGIDEPDSFLPLKEAAQRAGIAERTVRRYIADGNLETEKVKGPRGWEHRVYVPLLFSLLQEKSGAFERARSSPVEEMAREMAGLCRMIVDQQARADQRTTHLLEELRNQSRVIDELRAEQRDSRAQVHCLQDQMIRALMPRQKPPFWKRIFFAPYES